ncbi:ubiquitin-protein ligase E/phosphatidylinositol(3)-phosphate binding protein [Schizosaccharomyces japonicus yFS275]|uniref:Ubiquitin-protein ligase E/phosphatidylinositol(3)-phosphate binding protein n=1 Tax=Schizosaccharomyces japonicus (strain yFS275 / FY16936) TaxID=402676 RepID=B6JXN3_SCHJY|nr:ubiquitin-protein ligase E/phosphatidylinositol(3)-phosphate binding protein [Schizosaccharomyces japonicus yFS275]EEB05177.1 ubiquitin-protein ligase E/phosphatidylinositol(3)-phosphate binding protein [Schizosaccharomyces japonicus yFS275]
MSETLNRQTHFQRAKWQPDSEAIECVSCGTPFTFFHRRHHCRKCGFIFCNNCSNHFAFLPLSHIAYAEYEGYEDDNSQESLQEHDNDDLLVRVRVCDNCFNQTENVTRSSSVLMDMSVEDVRNRAIRTNINQSTELLECPVCCESLASMDQEEQEEHLRSCLDFGSPNTTLKSNTLLKKARQYIYFQLNEDSPCLGEECIICFEEFAPGDNVARLAYCLCIFHLDCYRDWLHTGAAGCPVHAANIHIS